jgi:hypothetical protein
MFGRANLASVLVTVALVASASAQFGNVFEQFMGGQQQQQHHRAPQNVASDSSWYQQTYANGIFIPFFLSLCIKEYDANTAQLTAPITFAQGRYVSIQISK